MVKKFTKFILALGLLVSISHFQLRSESPVVDFDSYLQPQDLELLEKNEKEQNEPMVFMSPDVLDVIASMGSMTQMVKDLVEHVKLGYCVAPQAAVKQAVEEMIKSADITATERSVLAEYQESLVKGEALIRQDATRRAKKHGKYCDLFVKKCAVFGCARVLGNLNVCGTIAACNFTAFTGTTGGIVIPGAVVDGNVVFNVAGVNELDLQGAVEPDLRNIRGTLAFSSSAITLTSTAPDTTVTVGGTLPRATIFRGTGFSLGAITATASSKSLASTTAVGSAYSFTVNIQVPVIFATPYAVSPTIVLGFERLTPGSHGLVDANSSAVAGPGVAGETISGVVFSVVFNIVAQGATYADATANAATTVNSIFAAGRLLNFLCQGPVA